MAWSLRIEQQPNSIRPQSRGRTGSSGHFYSVASKPLKEWRKAIAAELKRAVACKSLPSLSGEPVRLWIEIAFKRPASHYRASGSLKPLAPTHPGKSKGDVDNLYKCIADEIERAAVLACDGDVCDCRCLKRWGVGDEPEHAVIHLHRWSEVIDGTG